MNEGRSVQSGPAPGGGGGVGKSAPGTSGWTDAVIYLFLLTGLSVAYAYGHEIGAHPVAFVLFAMLFSAIGLLAIAGPGPDWAAIMLSPMSWLIGFTAIAMEAFYYLLVAHVTPAEASLQVRLSIPIAMMVGWMVIGRKSSRPAMLGGLIVVLGILGAFALVPARDLPYVVGYAVAASLMLVGRSFFAELHPWNRRAADVTDKLRITGLVVLVMAMTALIAVGGATLAVQSGLLPSTRMLPTLAELTHRPTLVFALVIGGVIMTAFNYYGFSAVVKVTSEGVLALSALLPVTNVILQEIAWRTGLIRPVPFDWRLTGPILALILGVVLILWRRRAR